jgi:hypothetical protein
MVRPCKVDTKGGTRKQRVVDAVQKECVEHWIAGMTIGEVFEDCDHGVVRVVAIDPEMHHVEAEDLTGAVLVDDIEHFTATHWPLAG